MRTAKTIRQDTQIPRGHSPEKMNDLYNAYREYRKEHPNAPASEAIQHARATLQMQSGSGKMIQTKLNKINSICPQNKYYKNAMQWAEKYIKEQ